MKILLIIGIVLAAIALIITVILLLPVRVLIGYDDKNGQVTLLYRFLGMTFGEEPNPDSAISKGAKKITGISKLDSLGSVRGNISDIGVSATIGQIVDILGMLLGRVVWILKYCVIEKFNVDVVCVGSDAANAAMEYGAVCAVIYPIIGYIHTMTTVKDSGENINVTCDFEGSDGRVALDTVIRVRIVHLVRALFYIIKENAQKNVYDTATANAKNG